MNAERTREVDMKNVIVVKGAAEAHVFPDRAVLSVSVKSRSPSSQSAYVAAAGIAERVDAVLDRHDGAIERSKVAELSVEEQTQYKDGEWIRTGWLASRTTTVDVIAFDGLTTLIAELIAAGATIDSTIFKVDGSNPVHDDIRAAAAADARRRAQAYASGLGIEVGQVRRVSEPSSTRGAIFEYDTMEMSSKSTVLSDRELTVNPADLLVTASITVAFAIGGA